MGSSRLPGKVLKDLAGKPLLLQILNQLKAVSAEVVPVIACSTDERDDELVRFGQSHGITVSRGPADDIVARLAGAARSVNAPSILRVWGDCPFVCPDVVEAMVSDFESRGLDYLTNGESARRTLPVGLDVELYRAPLLDEMNSGTGDAFYREFPLQYVLSRGSALKWDVYAPRGEYPHAHMTVDYPEDLVAANEIYRRLSPEGRAFRSYELFALLEREPALIERFSQQARQADFKEKQKQHQQGKIG